jgi:DNA-binding MarR family transcriptional regulator
MSSPRADSAAVDTAEEPAPSLLLDDQMCFALYAASRAVTGLYRPLLDDLGLTYPQYLVLLVLWDRGAVPIKDLSAALQLDYSTLSPLLKRLESRGLIHRTRRADDERSVLIALTDAGAALRGRAREIPVAIGEAMGLDDAESDRLRSSLRRLTGNVTRASAAQSG